MTRAAGRAAYAALVAAASLLALTACGGDTSGSAGSGAGSGDSAGSGGSGGSSELTVLAAASLTEVFTDLGETFEQQNPGVSITFAFDSSATLAAQAAEGAPADVLATADQRTMDDAAAADVLAAPARPFATNSLVLVTPPQDPGGVSSVTDLDRGDVAYVVCVLSAPCGDLAARALELNDVDAPAASQEVDVKAVLAKVAEDEADAGIVYATDAVAAGEQVRALDLAGSDELLTTYPAAVLEQSAAPGLARAWIRLLTSPTGRQALRDAGFSAP